ncbi:hypothetical protein [Anaerocolumna chitinilytica]|uniref:Lipid-A-disaccharide synthase n=1 Tax=Anaerocolumna chitinilytica TaxID=1727145 RepID=A0A7M3SA72_9FIRM|nr:hypothetical protein [Anaerocolumna chitinilytica]BCK01490.1 hypothetical protein bsdcttw_45300 [Anaerocolumna chitinilytica]
MKILLNAVPFGYGPVSKIFSIALKLIEEGNKCVFCGCGIAYEYIKREEICEVVYIDVREEEDRNHLKNLADNFDYILTSMNPDFVKVVQGKKIGYVDSLFWMWDDSYFDVNKELIDVDNYFIQNTFNAKERLSKFNIKNPYFVGSIVNTLDLKKQFSSKVVIHYGGVENIYTPIENITYPFKMTEFLYSYKPLWEDYELVDVICSERISNKLSENIKNEAWKFHSKSHKEFLKSICECDILITTPGLTTLLEAYTLGIPTIFLPPQNYSQYLILKGLENSGYPFELLNLPYIIEDFYIANNITEEDAVNYISKKLKEFFQNKQSIYMLCDKLFIQIKRKENRELILEFEKKFINMIGTDGIENICNIINENN